MPGMDDYTVQVVSILAHPEGRALLIQAGGFHSYLIVSILAHPEGRALLGITIRISCWAAFQSSPTPKGGRYTLT